VRADGCFVEWIQGVERSVVAMNKRMMDALFEYCRENNVHSLDDFIHDPNKNQSVYIRRSLMTSSPANTHTHADVFEFDFSLCHGYSGWCVCCH
jgi:L-amino acid N-acyltransferase YncA